MTLNSRPLELFLVPAGLLCLAAWPLSAYAFDPVLLPMLIVLAGLTALALYRIEFGIATVVALLPMLDMSIPMGSLGSAPLLRFMLPTAAAALLVWAALTARRESEAVATRGLTLSVSAFLLVTLASILFGSEPPESFGEFIQLLVGGLLLAATLTACRKREQINVVLGGVVAALLLASVQGVIQQATGQFSEGGLVLEGEAVGRIAGSFGHPNQYGGFLAALIPVAGALVVLRDVSKPLRILGGVALAFAFPALMFAYTRGAVGALIVAGFLWIAMTQRRLGIGFAVLAIVGGLAFAPSAFKERLENVENHDIALRSDLWASAIDIYAASPVIGVGFSNFDAGYASLPSTISSASERRLLHQQQVLVPPHANNNYLTILAEEGILGLLAYLGIGAALFSLAWRASRAADPLLKAAGIGLGAGALTVALHGILELMLVPVFAPLLVLGGAVACLAHLARDGATAPSGARAS